MIIGTTIKMLRRKNDITQERLAELLNISASAISQWETNRVMPDVMQIPILANIFDVSADFILGIDIERKNEKIKEILNTAEDMSNNAQWQEEVEYLREQYRLYPRSYQIMEKLADALVNDYSRKNIKNYDEVITLCNTILAECTESEIRNKALCTLGFAYIYSDKTDEMQKVAEQMTEFRFSKENFLLWRMEGDEGLIQRQEYLAALIEQIVSVLSALAIHRYDNGELVYSTEDRMELNKQIVGFIELVYPDGDYQIKAQHGENACSSLSRIYFNSGYVDEFFYWLKKTCDYAICFDTYDFDSPHTSPALRGYSDGGWIMEGGCNHTTVLLDDIMSDKKLDGLKSDLRFKSIIDDLKKYAKKQ